MDIIEGRIKEEGCVQASGQVRRTEKGSFREKSDGEFGTAGGSCQKPKLSSLYGRHLSLSTSQPGSEMALQGGKGGGSSFLGPAEYRGYRQQATKKPRLSRKACRTVAWGRTVS